MLFFGRLADKKTDRLARGFELAQLIGARAYWRAFRRCLRRLFADLLRWGSDYALPRYCFVFLRLFVVCPLNIYLLMTDVRFQIG